MIYGLILTECSIVYLVILGLIYNKKEQFGTIRSKMYRFLIIFALIFSITETVSIFAIKYFELFTLSAIMWKIHYVICILWWGGFYYYFDTIVYSREENNIFKLLKNKILNIIVLILFLAAIIMIIIMDIPTTNINVLDFYPGKTEYILIPMGIIAGIFVLIDYLLNIKVINNNKKTKQILIVTFILFVVCSAIQFLFSDISITTISFVLELFLLYFIAENPDLKVLEEINSAQGDIEKSNQTKTDFLSNMTYEIKVPMNLIMTLCDELVNMQSFDEKLVREDISQILASGNSLLDIINNILDISKIETGKNILQEKDYKLNDLLRDIINIANSKIGSKAVKLVVNVDKNISTSFNGDYAKIYQALINVVTNATKYTEVGKIILTLTSTKLSGTERLLFKITDTGTGIKEEDQAKLFSKGTRLDNATEGEIEGSGLGLVITKQYIEAMGGKIWFDSQFNVGTNFYIEVPQKIVDATPIGNAAAEETEKKEVEKIDCSSYRLLIVDDNLLNIKVAKRLLEVYKFNIDSVTSGNECVYKIKAGEKYDAIFMDHMMPELDGIETLHILKKLDMFELPPVVALTANAIAGMKEMYLSEGFDDYLSKPISTMELDRIVNKYFKK